MRKDKKVITTDLKGLLRAINIIGEDIDVYVDGLEAIAVVPPICITKAGREYFKDALSAKVEVDYERLTHMGVTVCDEREGVNEKAFDLLYALAGYVPCKDFDKWFEDGSEEIL